MQNGELDGGRARIIRAKGCRARGVTRGRFFYFYKIQKSGENGIKLHVFFPFLKAWLEYYEVGSGFYEVGSTYSGLSALSCLSI